MRAIRPPSSGKRKAQRAERAGRLAEWASSLVMQLMGWRILARRKRTKYGEIDLVCRRGNMLLCIEVKYRRTKSDEDMALPSLHQQKRLAAAARYLWAQYQQNMDTDDLALRFDIHLWTGFGRLYRRTNVALDGGSWHFNTE